MNDLDYFARRYAALWNEPDAERRRAAIAELFAPDAVHYTPSQEVRGHAAMEVRVTDSHEKWVAPGTHAFRAVPGATGHHGAVRFTWEMVDAASGEVVSVGSDFVVRDREGLITSDHQFVDG